MDEIAYGNAALFALAGMLSSLTAKVKPKVAETATVEATAK
jgi:hypothetical protein